MTGREFLLFFSKMRGVDTASEHGAGWPNVSTSISTGSIKEYSKGNRQKVGVVNAFMHEPELLDPRRTYRRSRPTHATGVRRVADARCGGRVARCFSLPTTCPRWSGWRTGWGSSGRVVLIDGGHPGRVQVEGPVQPVHQVRSPRSTRPGSRPSKASPWSMFSTRTAPFCGSASPGPRSAVISAAATLGPRDRHLRGGRSGRGVPLLLRPGHAAGFRGLRAVTVVILAKVAGRPAEGHDREQRRA